jgi:hypothetical protein
MGVSGNPMKNHLDDRKKCNRIFSAAVYLRGKEVEGVEEIRNGATRVVGKDDG